MHGKMAFLSHGSVALHHRGMYTTSWMNCEGFRTVWLSLVHNKTIRNSVFGLLHRLNHWGLPLRHGKDVDDLFDELQMNFQGF